MNPDKDFLTVSQSTGQDSQDGLEDLKISTKLASQFPNQLVVLNNPSSKPSVLKDDHLYLYCKPHSTNNNQQSQHWNIGAMVDPKQEKRFVDMLLQAGAQIRKNDMDIPKYNSWAEIDAGICLQLDSQDFSLKYVPCQDLQVAHQYKASIQKGVPRESIKKQYVQTQTSCKNQDDMQRAVINKLFAQDEVFYFPTLAKFIGGRFVTHDLPSWFTPDCYAEALFVFQIHAKKDESYTLITSLPGLAKHIKEKWNLKITSTDIKYLILGGLLNSNGHMTPLGDKWYGRNGSFRLQGTYATKQHINHLTYAPENFAYTDTFVPLFDGFYCRADKAAAVKMIKNIDSEGYLYSLSVRLSSLGNRWIAIKLLNIKHKTFSLKP